MFARNKGRLERTEVKFHFTFSPATPQHEIKVAPQKLQKNNTILLVPEQPVRKKFFDYKQNSYFNFFDINILVFIQTKK